MDTIRIGVIGCGHRMFGLVRGLCRRDPDIRVEAICEPNAEHLQRAKDELNPDMRVHADHHALAGDDGIDWVLIGSINSLHAEHAIACLEAGKDVICEKPLATTLDDCLAIRRAVETSGRRLAVGFTMRYGKMNRLIRQIIDEGRIGQPISLEFNEILGFNHGGMIHSNWRRFTKFAGTHLLEKCCHDIDCTEWFVQSRAARVASFGGCNFFTPDYQDQVQRVGPGPDGQVAFQVGPRSECNPFTADKDIVDNQVVILEYDNHVRASFHLNCCAAITERRMYICGSEGTIRSDRTTGRLEVQRIGWDEPMTVWPDTRGTGGHGGADDILGREWIDMMRHGRAPAAGVEEGLRAAATCFAIDQAATTGRVVDLAEMWGRIDGETAPAAPVASV